MKAVKLLLPLLLYPCYCLAVAHPASYQVVAVLPWGDGRDALEGELHGRYLLKHFSLRQGQGQGWQQAEVGAGAGAEVGRGATGQGVGGGGIETGGQGQGVGSRWWRHSSYSLFGCLVCLLAE